jgi:PST family polysaccharide transporter
VPEHPTPLSLAAPLPSAAPGAEAPPLLDPPDLTGPHAGIGQAVGGGVTWMVIASVLTRILSFVNQIALGYLLVKEDFGIFAIATALSFIIISMRDGGLASFLVQRGPATYASERGPVFWLAALFNAGGAVVLFAMAPFAARAYHEPRLVWMLVVLALTLAVSTPAAILQAALRVRLRFGHIARINTISACIRYVGVIALAAAGMGPLSFVIPALISTLYEITDQYLVTREHPWKDPARRGVWRDMLSHSKWLMLLQLATVCVYFGNYMTTGLVVSKEVVGTFFFAFSIVNTTGYLIAINVEQVLIPSLSRLNDQPARFGDATARFLRAMAILCIPTNLAIGLIYPAAAALVWGEKWTDSVLPVQVLSVGYPILTLHIVPKTALTAAGRFRDAFVLVLVIGLGLMAAGALGGLWRPTPLRISITSCAWMIAASLGLCLFYLPRLGVRPSRTVGAVTPAAIIALAAAAPAFWLDRELARHLVTQGRTAQALALLAARVGMVGGLFTLLTAVLYRLFMPAALREVAAIAPRKLGRPMLRLLRL